MTTVRELIKELQCLKSELQFKEVLVLAENGEYFSPEIAFQLKDYTKPLDKSSDNVKAIILRG